MIVIKTKENDCCWTTNEANDFLLFCQNKLPKFNTSEVGEIAREHGWISVLESHKLVVPCLSGDYLNDFARLKHAFKPLDHME